MQFLNAERDGDRMAMTKPDSETGKELVRRFWEDVFNQGDAGGVAEIVSGEFRLRDLSTGEVLNRENLRDLVDGLQKNLEKPEAEIVEQFQAEDDRVVTRLVFRARPLGSGDQYEEPVEINALTIDRVENGVVADTTLMWDAWTADSTLRPDDIVEWRFPWW